MQSTAKWVLKAGCLVDGQVIHWKMENIIELTNL